MWVREDLKQRAKNVLRKYYWIAFLVTLVASILGGISRGSISQGSGFNFNRGDWNNFNRNFEYGHRFNWNDLINDPNVVAVLSGIVFGTAVLSGIFLIVFALSYAFKIFLGGQMEIGMSRYFLEARQDKSDFVNLFYSFRSGRYMNAVKAIAWRELFIFLWTLLFIIPGWIKGYSYSMIPYLMADNPTMDYKRAMTLSMAMTSGEKWNIFVLDLSFLGWYLLGVLACCIGTIFVHPYFYATKAELYVTLRQQAIDKGLCSADEVGQALPAPVV